VIIIFNDDYFVVLRGFVSYSAFETKEQHHSDDQKRVSMMIFHHCVLGVSLFVMFMQMQTYLVLLMHA